MPAIIIKNPTPNKLDEYVMLEIQGDLELRSDKMISDGRFIGDLLYNKYGNPILIVGHHILFGKEKKLDNNGFAVIKKVSIADDEDEKKRRFDETIINETVANASISVLDSTINVENRTKPQVEYQVLAVIKKKLVFNQRPRPIISNLPKSN
ncbi:hypothetical protein PVAND_001665 [Polypedilum vanderplanki]|uniref:Chromosome transmission fidelity protein 8 n=1 Tax=Polypedilum vanderplanki TaxID=319348 RepID=A0A9J6BPX6_POLVA|nr:hypothetical protein PVAND_001665 [Polypedilum vanderplanki]